MNTVEEILNMDINDMPGYAFDCGCGRRHSIDINKIILGPDALLELPCILDKFKDKTILLVYDDNTWSVAGERAAALLEASGYTVQLYKAAARGYPIVVPDEAAIGRLLIDVGENVGILVGVGSGSINDLCKFVSYKMKLPSMTVATAPSMDGYASTMSPLIVDRHKVTYPSQYPYAVLADTSIMKTAPDIMFRAGFGDIVGKYTALADWRLTVAMNNEFYCATTEKLVRNAVDLCVANVAEYMRRDEAAIGKMAEALILAGVAMGLVGITRPASGSEHHLSHYWELDALARGAEHPLHGNSVGVASIVSAEAYKIMGRRFEEISRINAPQPDFLREIYSKCGSALSPAELGIDRELFCRSLNEAYRIRPRYTIFNFTKDRGMLPEIANIITDIFY